MAASPGEVPGAPWGAPCGVAIDPDGNVYVGLASGHVNKYTPTANPVSNTAYVASLWGLTGEVCNIAVDPTGNVYADTWSAGPVIMYAPSQFSPIELAAEGITVDAGAGSTLAANPSPSSQILYVNERNLVAEYEISSEARRIGTFGGTGAGALSGTSFGVAGNATGEVYVADGNGRVDIFGPREVAPVHVGSEYAFNVTSTSVSLGAQINPAGTETTYYFQYGTENCSEHPSACTSAPLPPGIDIGAGESDQAVSTHIQGLAPGTIYHYRVIADSENGTVDGEDGTFQTRGPGGPPALADDRGWEMTSPLDKNSALLTGIDSYPTGTLGGLLQAAANGGSIAYASNGAFANPAGAPLSTQYLATRGAGGWSTVSLIPPIETESYFAVGQGGPYKAFSEDLADGLFVNGENPQIRNPPLTPDAPSGYQDFYVQRLANDSFQSVLTSTPPEAPAVFELKFAGASADLAHVVFSTAAALTSPATPGSPGVENLYEWFEGHLRLINILPHETTGTPGAVLGGQHANHPGGLHPVSADGSRIFFTYENTLYVRENATTTVQVDESKEGLESGDGQFQTASSDGSHVFFLDRRKLTSDSTASTTGLQRPIRTEPRRRALE